MRPIVIAPLIWGASFILFSAFIVLGDYQNHGGDFGQYIIQARNLLLDRPWDYLVAGYPSPFPTYSALLALVTYFLGYSPYAYGLLNAILWATGSWFAYLHFRRLFESEVHATFYLGLVMFSPYVVGFQQSGVPNILFSTSISAALYGSKLLIDKRPEWHLYPLFLMPAFIRPEAAIFYVSLLLAMLLRRQWIRTVMPLLGLAITLAILAWLSVNYNLTSYLEVAWLTTASSINHYASESEASRIFVFFRLSSRLFLDYVLELGAAMTSPDVSPGRPSLTSLALCSIATLGILRTRASVFGETLYFFLHLICLSTFILPLGVETRLLLPILPFYIFLVVHGLESLASSLRIGPLAKIAMLVVPLSLLTIVSLPYQVKRAERMNSLQTDAMSALADWIVERSPEGPIVYYKARLLSMLLDLRSAKNPQVIQFRTFQEAVSLLEKGGLVIIHKTEDLGQRRIFEQLSQHNGAIMLREDVMHGVFSSR